MKIFFSGFGESADMGSSIIHNNSDSINGFTDIFKENYQNKNKGKMSEF